MNHPDTASAAMSFTTMTMHVAIILGVAYRIWRGEQTHRTARRTEDIIKNGKSS